MLVDFVGEGGATLGHAVVGEAVLTMESFEHLEQAVGVDLPAHGGLRIPRNDLPGDPPGLGIPGGRDGDP